MAGAGAQETPKVVLEMERRPEIVDAIARARASQRRRFRLISAATWLALIVIIVGSLVVSGNLDGAFIAEWAPYILEGVPITLIVSFGSIILAIVFATLGALGRLSRNPVSSGVAGLYVSLVRGTPLIVQIIFLYLALPQIWDGFARVPLIVLGIFGLAFNYGAYMTEIFRAGIQAIPRGQIEAAGALGMPNPTIMRRIVLPQAIRIVTPAIGNEFIALIKDSALVSIIGVQELLWRAQRAGQPNFRALETLLFAAVVYWILTLILSYFQGRLERRMAQSDVRL